MKLLLYPDARLTAPNTRIEQWTPEIAEKVAEMTVMMDHSGGLDLAAPQVGWNVRLFIMKVPTDQGGDGRLRIIYNPLIEPQGFKIPVWEGCLSFPGIGADVERWHSVRLLGSSPEGKVDETLEGLAAQVIQHEGDHLEGILFIDRMSEVDRLRVQPMLKRLRERKN